MPGRRRLLHLSLIAGAVLVAAIVTRQRTVVRPTPAGAFSFAVLGDAPYHGWEEPRFRLVLRAIDAHDVAWVVHVGDIFWRPCTDQHYLTTRQRFDSLHHAVIYTPGDNEWADCWQGERFAPLDRLAAIRRIFFSQPTRTLGGSPFPLVRQSGEFVEHARWQRDGVVFATVHLVGSRNATEPFLGRTAADDAASRRRTEAAAVWLRQTFAEARVRNAHAVVIAFHANAGLEGRFHDPYRQAYEPFLTALEEEVEQFGKPVLLVHGDGHVYLIDHPLVRRTTGRRLANFTRMQVPGSPEVGWVRVVVRPDAAAPFAFEESVVPALKVW